MGALADQLDAMTPTEAVAWMRSQGVSTLSLGGVSLGLGALPTAPFPAASAPTTTPLPEGAIRCADCGAPILKPTRLQAKLKSCARCHG